MANRDITELLFHLSSNDYKIKIKAVGELGTMSSIEAYEALKLMLKKNDAVLRPHIKTALGEIEAALKKNDVEIIDKISEAGQGEKKSGGLNYDVFLKYINDEEPKNRISVLAACPKIGRDPRIAEILTDRLASENHSFVVASILINLGRVGGEDCIDIIASFLTHQDARIRANAVEGLDFLQAPQAVLQILKAAGDSDPRVMANVARALLNVDNQYVENQLLAMLGSGDQAQIEAANYVIGRIKFKFKKAAGEGDEKKPKVPQRPESAKAPAAGVASKNEIPVPRDPAPSFAEAPAAAAGWPKYAVLFAVSLMAAYFYYSYAARNPAAPGTGVDHSPGAAVDYGAYENELRSKIASIVSEAERAIAEKKAQEAFIAVVQLKKISSDHPMIKIYEAEVKMLENQHRTALALLKQAQQIKNPRYYYLLASCYFRLNNLNEADSFAQLAVKSGAGDIYGGQAASLIAEIKKIRETLLKEAKEGCEKSLGAFYEILNAEGPKALRQYFLSKTRYDLFEDSWRSVLFEVKQWKIEHIILDAGVIQSGGNRPEISARVLEKWQHQNYGGVCGVAYYYKEFHFARTAPDHAFETGSVALELVVSGLNDAAADASRFEPYEEKYKKELSFIYASRLAGSDFTASAALVKKIMSGAPEFMPAVLELVSKPGLLSREELDGIYSFVKKRAASDKCYDYFPGGAAVKATALDYIANCYLDFGDKKTYKKIIDEIISENNSYANAQFETAIFHNGNGDTAECVRAVEAALKIEPDFAALESYFRPREFHINNAIMKRAEERFDQKLIDELEAIIKEEPGYWRSFFNAGKLMLVLGAEDKAELFFNGALKLSPDNCSVLTKLALCCYLMKDIERAKKFCASAEKLEPHNFQVKRMRAMLSK
jgi:HEAT repeat protein/Flp pilus assembly protein TadD